MRLTAHAREQLHISASSPGNDEDGNGRGGIGRRMAVLRGRNSFNRDAVHRGKRQVGGPDDTGERRLPQAESQAPISNALNDLHASVEAVLLFFMPYRRHRWPDEARRFLVRDALRHVDAARDALHTLDGAWQ